MTDPYWPFPTKEHPLTPPKPEGYADYAIKVAAEVKPNKTKVVPKDALV